MFKKSLKQAAEFVAGDATHLREILHPHNDPVDIGYSIAHAYIKPGESSLPHRLIGSEVYHFIAGKGIIYINKENQVIQSGDTVYVPPGGLQFVENTGEDDLIFICIVEPAWTLDGEIVQHS